MALNLAVTKDGDSYNKLRRPDDYLMSTSRNASPLTTASSPTIHIGKRKSEQDMMSVNKRPKTGRERSRNPESAWDTGMKTVLPGLYGEDQSTDESMSEAIAYLQSVRSEATTIPTLLVAPTNVLDDGDSTRHIAASQHELYEEDAGISVNNEYNVTSESQEDTYSLSPQESWHRLLLGRFRALRKKLTEASPDDSVAENSKDLKQTRQFRNKRSWAKTVECSYPNMKELHQMDETTLYTALQGCDISLRHSSMISHMQSCWIWSVLALAGDFGILDNERISRIRDLGVQAGQLGRRLRAGSVSPQDDGHEHVEIEGLDTTAHENEDIESSQRITRKDGVQQANVHESHEDGASADGNESGSGAEMITSEDEDQVVEVVEKQEAEKKEAEKKELEQLRAVVLAQLEDRLVRSEAASPDIAPTEISALRSQQLSRAEAEQQLRVIREREARRGTAAPTPADSDWNTKATIDMILTVVAECYGQKDLLAFREAW